MALNLFYFKQMVLTKNENLGVVFDSPVTAYLTKIYLIRAELAVLVSW